MENKFLFDANSIINMGQRHYPIDMFSSLWNHFNSHIDLGMVVISDGVIAEIKDKIDDVHANRNLWRNDLITHASNSKPIKHGNYQLEFAEIANKCNSDDTYRGQRADSSVAKFLSKADVWLISIAQKEDFILVSEENEGTLKIPTICKLENVTCIKVVEYFRMLGMKFDTSI